MHRYIQILTDIQVIRIKLQVSHGGQGHSGGTVGVMLPPTLPLAERVAELRRQRGLSQRELGAAMGRSESWVSQVERGVQPVERVAVLQTLAETAMHPNEIDRAEAEKELQEGEKLWQEAGDDGGDGHHFWTQAQAGTVLDGLNQICA